MIFLINGRLKCIGGKEMRRLLLRILNRCYLSSLQPASTQCMQSLRDYACQIGWAQPAFPCESKCLTGEARKYLSAVLEISLRKTLKVSGLHSSIVDSCAEE
jgi:hypothetical protein